MIRWGNQRQWIGAAVALLAALSCAPEGPEVGAEPIRIGVIVSLTGSLGSVGDHLLQSAQLAEREVLAAGGLLGGRPVEIVFGDDRTDADQAASIARRMIEEDGVVAIIGSLASSASLAVQEVTLAARIPQITCCSTSEDLTSAQPAEDRFLFRTVSSDLLQAEVSARYAAERCERLAILHIDDAYGTPFASSIATRFEALSTGTVVSNTAYASGLPSYSAEVSAIAAQNPDCIALVAFPDEGGFILRDWNALDMPPDVLWIGSDGLKDPGFPEKAGSASFVDGVVGTAPINEPETDTYNDYSADFFATYSAAPGIFGAQQYDAAMLLMLAIERAGSTDGEAIRDSLFQVSAPTGTLVGPGSAASALQLIREGVDVNYNGASGPVDLDANGNVVADYEIWRYDATAGSFVRDSIVRASELNN